MDVLDEVCAPSYQHETFGGVAGVKQAIVEIRRGFPDMRQTVKEMVAEGDKVAVRVTWRGTHTGEYEGIAPTGRVVTANGATFYRFVDGKVVEDGGIIDVPDVRQLLLD